MEQIEKLWDSILQGYPVAAFLFWYLDDSNVTDDTDFCMFKTEIRFNHVKEPVDKDYNTTIINVNNTDTEILDGQQRLTSLFLSLWGKTYKSPKHAKGADPEKASVRLLIELNKNNIETDDNEYNSKRFDIKFSDKVKGISPTRFAIRDIVFEKYREKSTREGAIEEAVENVPPDSKDYARNVLRSLCNKVYEEELLRFTGIYDMKQDGALETFVRFNSGGKPLTKADVTYSILEAYWPAAKSEIEAVLEGSYEEFKPDFIIRAALMLYGDVVKSSINKKTVKDLHDNWSRFSNVLTQLDDLSKEMQINVSRFSRSWNVLLPVFYCVYHNSKYRHNIDAIRSYLLRAIFFAHFRSGTTGKLQQLRNSIKEYEYEITMQMLDQMDALTVTDGKIEDILNSVKGRVTGEVLYYLNIDRIDTLDDYEQDHLHPSARFFQESPFSVTNEEWMVWYRNRNRLPNLCLLEKAENKKKSNKPLVDYFNDMRDEERERFNAEAVIPNGVSLDIKDFGDFYEARKEELAKKIRALLG